MDILVLPFMALVSGSAGYIYMVVHQYTVVLTKNASHMSRFN